MVKYIQTPDGVKRPFKFSWVALRRLADELGVEKLTEIQSVMSELPIAKVPVFLHIGFEQGAKSAGLPVDFTADTVEGWLDDDMNLFLRAFEAFGDQIGSDEKNAVRAKANRRR